MPVTFFSSGGLKTLAVVAAFALAAWLAATGVANAGDNGAAWGTNEITKAGYTTTKSSGKLIWLSYDAEPGDAGENVTQIEHPVRWTPAPPADNSRQSATGSFDNPFGDKKTAADSESAGVKSSVAKEKEIGVQLKPDNFKGPNIGGQTLEQALAAKNPDLKDGCLSVKDLKKISQLTTNITPSPGDLPKDCPWGGDDFRPRSWAPVTFTWTASALCHHPLYFEDVQVERYGHTLGPWLQPFASAARFYLTVPILPYKMGLELPDECMYSLGYYRPGDCAPYMLDPLPLSIRATVFEAGAWVAGAAIIP
ncbi:MAG: hypothetical protein ABSA77_03510 [Thermoguttaceae bacterium]